MSSRAHAIRPRSPVRICAPSEIHTKTRQVVNLTDALRTPARARPLAEGPGFLSPWPVGTFGPFAARDTPSRAGSSAIFVIFRGPAGPRRATPKGGLETAS